MPLLLTWINAVWPSDAIWRHIWVNIGSGNGLLPNGTKSLPEPMLTSSDVFCGIHFRVISQEMLINLIRNMCSEIVLLKSPPHLPATSELTLSPLIITSIKLLMHSQTSTVLQLRFGNEWVISSHILLCMWLVIDTETRVNPCCMLVKGLRGVIKTWPDFWIWTTSKFLKLLFKMK